MDAFIADNLTVISDRLIHSENFFYKLKTEFINYKTCHEL